MRATGVGVAPVLRLGQDGPGPLARPAVEVITGGAIS